MFDDVPEVPQNAAKFARRKLRPPGKVPGGKAYLSRKIIPHLPQVQKYCEPFGGGFSVGLNLVPHDWKVRIYNDANPRLVAVFCALRDRPDEFMVALRRIAYAEENFLAAKQRDSLRLSNHINPATAELDAAIDYFVRIRMSRGGLGNDFAWSERTRGGLPGDLNAWNTMVEGVNGLPLICQVMQGVEIRNVDGITLVAELSHDESCLMYLDPPYPHSTRTARSVYGQYEMSDEQHARLARVANAAKCAIAISGYDNPQYREWYSGWQRHEFEMANHAGQGEKKQRRLEVLWVNTHRRPSAAQSPVENHLLGINV